MLISLRFEAYLNALYYSWIVLQREHHRIEKSSTGLDNQGWLLRQFLRQHRQVKEQRMHHHRVVFRCFINVKVPSNEPRKGLPVGEGANTFSVTRLYSVNSRVSRAVISVQMLQQTGSQC